MATGPRLIGLCERCGNSRPLIAKRLCNPCYVRSRYEAREPAPCARCERVLRPFAKDLCKSCYQVLRRAPDASRAGSPEHIERTRHAGQKRDASPKWKGGRFVTKDGYVRVLAPDDYEGKRVHGGRYVNEHRLVAEQMIGRLLRPGEIVHHINHDRADNRPENLQVLPSVSAHRRLHAEEWRRERGL